MMNNVNFLLCNIYMPAGTFAGFTLKNIDQSKQTKLKILKS